MTDIGQHDSVQVFVGVDVILAPARQDPPCTARLATALHPATGLRVRGEAAAPIQLARFPNYSLFGSFGR